MPNPRAQARARDPRLNHVALTSALTEFIDSVVSEAVDVLGPEQPARGRRGPRHPYIVLVNKSAARLERAVRAAMRESVRQLPGRAQRGAVDAALRSVTPKIAQVLR